MIREGVTFRGIKQLQTEAGLADGSHVNKDGYEKVNSRSIHSSSEYSKRMLLVPTTIMCLSIGYKGKYGFQYYAENFSNALPDPSQSGFVATVTICLRR